MGFYLRGLGGFQMFLDLHSLVFFLTDVTYMNNIHFISDPISRMSVGSVLSSSPSPFLLLLFLPTFPPLP